MCKASVPLVGRLSLVERPLARILHRERGGDDAYLRYAMLVAGRNQHASDARVERQARELLAEGGELILLVDRAKLVQQRITVGDGARRRRIEKRKVGHLAEPEALGPQDDRRERRAQHLGVGKRRPFLELLLRVEANANAVGHAAAAP